jgi:hypothetical protein
MQNPGWRVPEYVWESSGTTFIASSNVIESAEDTILNRTYLSIRKFTAETLASQKPTNQHCLGVTPIFNMTSSQPPSILPSVEGPGPQNTSSPHHEPRLMVGDIHQPDRSY